MNTSLEDRGNSAIKPLLATFIVILLTMAQVHAADWTQRRVPANDGISKGKYSFTTPVLISVAGQEVLLAHMQKSLLALSLKDGRELWRHPFGSGYETHSADPVVTPAGVFISSGDDGGELVSSTASPEARLWKNKNLSTFTGSAVLVGGYLYGVDAGGYKKGKQEFRFALLSAADWRQWRGLRRDGQFTGPAWLQKLETNHLQPVWSAELGPSYSGPIISCDRALALNQRGQLFMFRARTEKLDLLDQRKLTPAEAWAHLAVAGDELFVRELNALVAYRCSETGSATATATAALAR